MHTYTTEYPSSVLFFDISLIPWENTIERNPTARAKYFKLVLQICFKILLVVLHIILGSTITRIHRSLLVGFAIIYNTTKSSKGKHNYICCYLVFVLRKSLCSLLEWSQDINIKSKIFRIKTHTDKIISDMYTTPITCKRKKKAQKTHQRQKRWKNTFV